MLLFLAHRDIVLYM